MGIECFRVQFPKGMDANEYALKVHAGRRRAWGVLLNKAEWMGKGAAAERRDGERAEPDQSQSSRRGRKISRKPAS